MSSPAILADIRKALARSCLAAFVRYTMPGYKTHGEEHSFLENY